MIEFFKFLLKLLIESKIMQTAISISIVILALSFGAALFVQAKHQCFNGIVATVVKEVVK